MKKNKKVAVIVSQYWKELTRKLLNSCLEGLEKGGLPQNQIDVFETPGSLEIPLLAKKLAKKRKYKGLIALGVVLKGKTFHFEQVSVECVKGCQKVSLEFEIPIIFEVLCVYDKKDAIERIKKRGKEAAAACLKMIKILESL